MHRETSDDDEIGLQPIVDSLPPNHGKNLFREELEEVETNTKPQGGEEGTGATLTRTQSKASVLAKKAKLIGLVLTLTGASFLNVS